MSAPCLSDADRRWTRDATGHPDGVAGVARATPATPAEFRRPDVESIEGLGWRGSDLCEPSEATPASSSPSSRVAARVAIGVGRVEPQHPEALPVERLAPERLAQDGPQGVVAVGAREEDLERIREGEHRLDEVPFVPAPPAEVPVLRVVEGQEDVVDMVILIIIGRFESGS